MLLLLEREGKVARSRGGFLKKSIVRPNGGGTGLAGGTERDVQVLVGENKMSRVVQEFPEGGGIVRARGVGYMG